jgi:tetratricopeptide (TPR) repeat protein
MHRLRPFLLLAVSLAFLAGCAASEQAKQKASIHFRLGSEYLQRGDPISALREFLEAEKLNPDDASVQFGLGSALNARGRFQDGLRHYRKALKLDPKFTEVHNAMGSTYLELGQWDDAIKEFEITLNDLLYLTPFYVENNLGWAYYKKGDFPRAIEHYRRALSMKPDFGLAYYNVGLAYKDNKQTEEAIAAMRSAISQVPNLLDAHLQLGILSFNAGIRDQARKAFEEVVRLSPQSDSARLAQQYLDLLKKSGRL